jgi:hypothetical protein
MFKVYEIDPTKVEEDERFMVVGNQIVGGGNLVLETSDGVVAMRHSNYRSVRGRPAYVVDSCTGEVLTATGMWLAIN